MNCLCGEGEVVGSSIENVTQRERASRADMKLKRIRAETDRITIPNAIYPSASTPCLA